MPHRSLIGDCRLAGVDRGMRDTVTHSKKILAAALVAVTALSAPLAAQDSPVVVELFTSQGCSSCPPADALLRDLAKRDDVLPLSLHVNYWDYIGWKDQFAAPRNGQRQKGYARAAGRDMVYTPQMIVNGREAVTGAKPLEVADLLMHYESGSAPESDITVTARRDGDGLSVSLSPAPGAVSGQGYDVHLVQYAPSLHARITRGENAGREIDYANVVRDWRVLGKWNGTAPATFNANLTDGLQAAVIVQQAGFGPIAAAARAAP